MFSTFSNTLSLLTLCAKWDGERPAPLTIYDSAKVYILPSLFLNKSPSQWCVFSVSFFLKLSLPVWCLSSRAAVCMLMLVLAQLSL